MNDLIYRQDAIDLVDDLRDYISVDGYWAWIERLKSLPTAQPKTEERMEKSAQNDPKGDLVSRKGAIDAFWQLDVEIRPSAIEAITNMLKSLPPAQPDLSEYSDKLWRKAYEQGKAAAQPERIRGRWTDKDGGLATCSACGDRWGVWSVMNFCPNCGADMRRADD